MKKFSTFMALAFACAFLSFSALAQSVTPNAGLQVPAYQQQNWQVPLIFDLNRIDNILGGTVAVPSIQLTGAITNANQAATKAYVDATAQGFLQASGATMTGPLVLAADPTQPLQAATKQYVDSHAGSGGGSMVYPNPGISVSTGSAWDTSIAAPSGAIVGTTDVQTVINKTIDGISPTIMGYLGDVTSDIQSQINALAPLASPALTGTPTAPTAALSVNTTQIATTAFVQSLVSNATANFLPLSGGSLQTGAALTLGDGSPAASQAYVATAISGLTGGTGGSGTTTTNQQLDKKTTSASTWNKICTATGVGGTTACGGVTGTPVSVTVTTKGTSPVLNTVGVTGAVAQYGLTVNSSANTQILVPTTIGTNYAATVFKREMWFEGGSNVAGVDNFETDAYMFDQPDDYEYMFGWQCRRNAKSPDTSSDFWQTDNFGGGWQNTAVPCSILAGHVYHYILWMHRDLPSQKNCTVPAYTYYDSNNTAHNVASAPGPCNYYDTFQLDDLTAGTSNTYNLNISRYAEPGEMGAKSSGSWPGWTTWSGIGSQIQIDVIDTAASSTNQQLVSMYVDDDSMTSYVPVASSGNGSQTVTETQGNLGEYDFDGSNPTSGLTSTGSPTLDTNTYFTSPNAMLFNAASQYFTAPLSSSASNFYGRFKIDVTTAASGNARVIELDAGSTQVFSLFLQGTNGVLTASNSPTTTSTACSSGAFPTSGWHLVELNWVEGATTGSYQVKIDGTSTCSITATNTGSSPITQVKFGSPGSPTVPWVYDLDNIGFSSTGWLGDVTVSNSGGSSAPLYDLFGSAAAVAQSSLQDSNNLSDLTNPSVALANLYTNPGTGSYVVTCASGANCSPVAILHGAGTAIASASTISPEAEVIHVTGTAAISTITLPYTGYSGCIRLIADAGWSTALGGNIANSITASPGTMYSACADANGTWYIR